MIKIKIIGTNNQLKSFLEDCSQLEIPVSSRNSFFRPDYECCLMPCYSYDDKQPYNIKLQTLHIDSYKSDKIFDLKNSLHKYKALVILSYLMTSKRYIESILNNIDSDIPTINEKTID